MLVTAEQEHELVVRVLRRYGAAHRPAAIQADWLVEADLRGHGSHGIARLPVLAARMERGLIVPNARPVVTWRTDSVMSVSGERGFGPVVAKFALEAGVARARRSGIALIAIANANHLGILAPYVEAVAREGMIGFATSTSEALVHPWGGRVAMVGTNPIALAVPADPLPFVLDMATGETSMGRILQYLELGQSLSPGWAVDSDGLPTTDPMAASHGAISPFGGAKGFGLGLALEVLVASLTATALGRDVHGTLDAREVCNKGDLFICIDPNVVCRSSQLCEISAYLAGVRATSPQPGSEGVRVPGDRATAERARRSRHGIEISAASWDAASALALDEMLADSFGNVSALGETVIEAQ